MAGSRVALVCMAASVITACATLPEYRDDPLTTADVIRHVKCELRDAVWSHPYNKWVQTWNAGLVFTLDVTHSGGLDSDNSWVFPLNQGATFSINLIGGFSGTATRVERITFKENLNALNSDQDLLCFEGEPDRHARLGGELGIADLLRRAGRSIDAANIKPSELAYNLDFVIKKGAGATPRFNLIPIGKEKTFTGSLKWAGSYSDTQSLKLTLTGPAAPCAVVADGQVWPDSSACPTPVYTVNVKPKSQETKRKGIVPFVAESQPGPRPPDVRRGMTPADEDKIDRAQSRNVLETIQGELRRQGIGN